MSGKRVTSYNPDKAPGQRLSDGVPDEIDAVVAARVNTPSSRTRTAADGRYRTVLTTPAPGTFDITVGTGVDDSGEEPVSVTDEAVAALVQSEVSATRAMLDSLYRDQAVLTDADIALLVTTSGTLARTAILNLISSEAGGVADDEDVAALITASNSATRLALDARYSLPAELISGAPSPVTVNANMGANATATAGGTRLVQRCTVTTGSNPVSGGILCTFALSGYTIAPTAFVNARDPQTAAANLFVLTSDTMAAVIAAGELNAMTSYVFEIMIVGY